MPQYFYVDRNEIREYLITIWCALGLVVAGNVFLWLNESFCEARLVFLCATFLFLALTLLMVPELYALRYRRIAIHENAISVAYRSSSFLRIKFKDIVELDWRGKHGRIEIHTNEALLVIPITAFSNADQLAMVKILRRRVQEVVQTDWPIFYRDTAIGLYHLANGRLATGKPFPKPKPNPIYAKVKVTREESIAGTWRACRLVNCILMIYIPLAIAGKLAENGIVGIDWHLLLAASMAIASFLTIIVWSIGAVFCMLTPKAGRTIRQRVDSGQPRKEEAVRESMTAGELLVLFPLSLTVAGAIAWGFYIVFHSYIGFLHTETAYACFFVFLIAYAGCGIVWVLLTDDSKMTNVEATQMWEHEVM